MRTLATILFIIYAGGVAAHDALPTASKPLGWTYPYGCCADYDCRQVGDSPNSPVKVLEKPEGYVISTTGEVIVYSDKRLRNSPDGEFHWCSVEGKNDSKTICLFVPPRGF